MQHTKSPKVILHRQKSLSIHQQAWKVKLSLTLPHPLSGRQGPVAFNGQTGPQVEVPSIFDLLSAVRVIILREKGPMQEEAEHRSGKWRRSKLQEARRTEIPEREKVLLVSSSSVISLEPLYVWEVWFCSL